MSNKQYIMSIDEGTTSARAILFGHDGQIVAKAQKEFKQYFPQPGWVEQDPIEIWNAVESVISEVLINSGIPPYKVRSIGITNQRETTVVWDKRSGKPIYNAIVWQSKQTNQLADRLKADGYADLIHQKTGLIVDSYFSGTKIRWILDHVKDAQKRAENGELLFGTIDSWLLWKLTGGTVHATDYTNASRTMIFNINSLKWDDELLKILNIPKSMLPRVESSSHLFGYTKGYSFLGVQIPIAGIAGDQQASLFGQLALESGMTKNTYGTGAFIMMNTGKSPKFSSNGLLTTIAYGINGKVKYALEGSIFVAGSAIQWLRDEMGLISSAKASARMAFDAQTNNGVYVVPAFTGLGAPYWDQETRGSIFGLTSTTTNNQIVRATIESLGFQTKDVLDTMVAETKIPIKSLVVDGGAAQNNYLMQFQANILNDQIERSLISETTAQGATYLAGLAVGFWKSIDEIKATKHVGTFFEPQMDQGKRVELYRGWKMAVQAARKFKE
ncbi:glycerol kinase GlpK [Fructilactobacillus fructivorans]|uniref:Glycerol kinase n=1 Tax=Fructilactobacillus fructivorans TaxID=1614 RepID=A0AAE6TW78_9LACO|nr:glycerol kinase GlpK [Fructilactobacillus fructivorans]QFX92624.1 glycerol kinase GlpK [Fructilactobacillus fructivorans]RDV65782.1 glycerol kinase [Fructilactobacillus fructivorans]